MNDTLLHILDFSSTSCQPTSYNFLFFRPSKPLDFTLTKLFSIILFLSLSAWTHTASHTLQDPVEVHLVSTKTSPIVERHKVEHIPTREYNNSSWMARKRFVDIFGSSLARFSCMLHSFPRDRGNHPSYPFPTISGNRDVPSFVEGALKLASQVYLLTS